MAIEKKVITTPYKKIADTVIARSKAESPDANSLAGDKKGAIEQQHKLQKAQREILADDEIRAFYSILRDATVNSGYYFEGSKTVVQKAEKVFKEIKFRKKFKRIVFDALSLLHGYVELEYNKGGKVMAINIPDATAIYPVLDIHGKIIEFRQNKIKTQKGKKKYIKWTPEEMVHFTIDESTADYYGVTYTETLKSIIKLKKDILAYIQSLFTNNAFRVHYHSEGVSQEDAAQYVDMIYSQYQTESGLVITAGSNQLTGKKYVDETILEPLMNMLNLLRNRILTLLRVPPIIAGTVDNSNRSNSDVQADVALQNRIQAIQEDLEDDINFELLPKMGLNNVEFKFKNNSVDTIKKVNEIIIGLLNAQANPKKTMEWVRELGYNYPLDLFPENMETADVSLDKNSTLHESRKSQDNFDDSNYGKISKDKE